MDIRFCDLCNESVPESDFKDSRAFVRKGRVICASCESAMGGADEPQALHAPRPGGPSREQVAASLRPAFALDSEGTQAPPARGGVVGGMALVLGLGSVAAIGLGGAFALEEFEGLQGELALVRTDLATARESARREQVAAFAPLRDRLAGVEGTARSAASEALVAAKAEVAALGERLEARAEADAELRKLLDESRLAVQELRAESAEAREQLTKDTTALQQLIGFHGDKLVELEERIREAGALVAVGAPPTAAGAAAPPPWQRHVEDLANPDAGIRLDAVFELGDTRDVAVVSHIIPMLEDEDTFVRMSAAQALDDLRAKTAVPALIETLDDDSSAVRESAVLALREITGQSFGFDPAAREGDRKKRIEQWRSWWRRSGDDFLTS